MTRIFFLFALALFFTTCSKDDPVIPNEEELITTLNYTLTPMGGGDAVVLSFKDLDGDGEIAPTITGGTLAANQTYTGALELLNEAETPAEDITAEIKEEDLDHQFFFSSTINDLTIAYTDQDPDGNPVGLSTTLTTGAATSGSLMISLLHKPVKTAAGVSNGDPSNAQGDVDIEVTLPIDVQ